MDQGRSENTRSGICLCKRLMCRTPARMKGVCKGSPLEFGIICAATTASLFLMLPDPKSKTIWRQPPPPTCHAASSTGTASISHRCPTQSKAQFCLQKPGSALGAAGAASSLIWHSRSLQPARLAHTTKSPQAKPRLPPPVQVLLHSYGISPSQPHRAIMLSMRPQNLPPNTCEAGQTPAPLKTSSHGLLPQQRRDCIQPCDGQPAARSPGTASVPDLLGQIHEWGSQQTGHSSGPSDGNPRHNSPPLCCAPSKNMGTPEAGQRPQVTATAMLTTSGKHQTTQSTQQAASSRDMLG